MSISTRILKQINELYFALKVSVSVVAATLIIAGIAGFVANYENPNNYEVLQFVGIAIALMMTGTFLFSFQVKKIAIGLNQFFIKRRI